MSPWTYLHDLSDPEDSDESYDYLPGLRPSSPDDYFFVDDDLTLDFANELGHYPADTTGFSRTDVPRLDLSSLTKAQPEFTFSPPQTPPPHEVIDLTMEDDYEDTPEPEGILTPDELSHSFDSPEIPFYLPPVTDYNRREHRKMDFDAAINGAIVDAQLYENPRSAYIRLHEYHCLQAIEEEEENLRNSMERICQLEELVRKYEVARTYGRKENTPLWLERRMQELQERRTDYEWLLYAI